jgi:hypothetical protein
MNDQRPERRRLVQWKKVSVGGTFKSAAGWILADL